ncbi:class I SAM-dependent methyltransferase [Bremerella sp. JC770]|uniref:class I SAM-dependent methyltransferase n=1 Tax=Bremerella sp. JC770 TaxID=3232137 RepID=UPI00345A9D53
MSDAQTNIVDSTFQYVPSPRLRGMFDLSGQPQLNLNERQRNGLADLRAAIDSGKIVLEDVDTCLCGERERVQISSHERWGLPLGAYCCIKCGLIYTSPRIAEESLYSYYHDYYQNIQLAEPPTKDTILFREGQGTKIFQLFQPRIASGTTSLKVLDIGCAMGSVIKEFALAARKAGISVEGVGYDYNQEFLDAFDSEGLNIRVLNGGIAEAAEANLHPDLVVMSHVFEHYNHPGVPLTSLKRILREDAMVYIEVPGVLDLQRRQEYNFDWLSYVTCSHPYHYNLISLTELLNRDGFTLVWGNETVESFFRLGDQSMEIEGNARRVLTFLEEIEYTKWFLIQMNDLQHRSDRHDQRLSRIDDHIQRLNDSGVSFIARNVAAIKRRLFG